MACDEITALMGSGKVYWKRKAPAMRSRSLGKPDAVALLPEPARYGAVAILTRVSRAESGSLPVRYAIASAMGVRREPGAGVVPPRAVDTFFHRKFSPRGAGAGPSAA
jgi:hypothetical protein